MSNQLWHRRRRTHRSSACKRVATTRFTHTRATRRSLGMAVHRLIAACTRFKLVPVQRTNSGRKFSSCRTDLMLSTVKTNRYALIKSQRIAVAEAVQVTQTLCGLHAKAVFDDLLAPTNH